MARPDPPGKNYPDITKMKKLDYNANVSENVKAIRKAMQDARIDKCAELGVNADLYLHIIRIEPKESPLSASCGCGCS